METPDELGVFAEYCRVSLVELLTHILWEIIANRKHNADRRPAKFLFMTFGSYFVLGTNQFRDRESIEKEHTPFKFNESRREAVAAISARGYGAKLFPFRIAGQYCNLFRINDSETFSTDSKDWGLKDWINIDQLRRVVDAGGSLFDKTLFRSQFHIPITSKAGRIPETPFFCEDEFQRSPLAEFVAANNFKYFYVFHSVNAATISQLGESLSELAKIYEGKDVHLYYSNNYELPKSPTFRYGFGLLPSNWTSALVFEWRMGERKPLSNDYGVREYWKSEFCLRIPGLERTFYGRNDSNGSAGDKFALRFASFEPPADWKPQLRITVAQTSPTYFATVVGGSDKSAEYLYLRIDDDLVSYRELDPKISSKLRNLKTSSRVRIVVDILEESLKTDAHAGLVVASVKSKSYIMPGKAIHEMLDQSLSLFRKHQWKVFEADASLSEPSLFVSAERVKELEGHINKNLAASNRSTRRKREGLVFEATVSAYLESTLGSLTIGDSVVDVAWEDNDATISATHGLDGQAIDTLGKIPLQEDMNVWVAVQSKDRESAVPRAELDAFVTSVNQLRVKKQALSPKDKVIAVLCLAKKKSFSLDVHDLMTRNGIHTVVESLHTGEAVGNATSEVVLNTLSLIA